LQTKKGNGSRRNKSRIRGVKEEKETSKKKIKTNGRGET
jgi:hypothetical protein